MNKYIKQLLNNVKINRYEIESSLTGLLCIFLEVAALKMCGCGVYF